MTKTATLAGSSPASLTTSTSRRRWLKGLGALFGSGLLAAPSAILAGPSAPAATSTVAASAAAGGDEYIGMVKLLAGTDLPVGWARCDGRLLPVAEHPALFAVLGAAHSGDGHHTFALPHLGEPSLGALGMQIAIKMSNGPATTTALAELRVVRRPRDRRA